MEISFLRTRNDFHLSKQASKHVTYAPICVCVICIGNMWAILLLYVWVIFGVNLSNALVLCKVFFYSLLISS